MSTAPDWEQANARHLAAALEWVRARLSAGVGRTTGAATTRGEPRRGTLGRIWRGQRHEAAGPVPDRDEPARAVRRAEARLKELEAASDPPLALSVLAGHLGLSRFERDLVLLCAAMELDTRVGALCARAQADPGRPYPTFGLALGLFDDPEWSALAPERPLRAWRLIEIHQPAATPLVASALRIDERILHFLKGLNQLDDRLAGLARRDDAASREGGLPPSQQAGAEAIVRAWQVASAEGGPWPVVQLLGPDPACKRLVAAHAARAVGHRLYRLPVEHLPAQPGESDALARLWQRESRLLPLVLYLDSDDAPSATADDGGPGAAGRVVGRFLAHADFLVILAAAEPAARLAGPSVAIDVARPTRAEQAGAWEALLGPGAEAPALRLASQFQMNLPEIARAVRTARAGLPEGDDPAAATVAEAAWEICRGACRPRVQGLAQRIDARATWADLVLPAEAEATLRQVASQVRHRATVYGAWGFDRVLSRGLGITTLFAGASGTGKTMAAEVLANDLGLDLFRIDLSAVINKYIGETEKNLRRLFDAFDESGAILFFDEADSLFGKRSEVKDSHDRYANIEVNYLLQRMETYRGLAVLATNAKSSLEPALLRRLRFVVDFPMPGTAERRRIWSRAFPRFEGEDPGGGVPTSGLDLAHLARLDLTGGHIHGAALNAAFRAAASGGPVTMTEVLAAARDEYDKLQRPIHESEFHRVVPVEAKS